MGSPITASDFQIQNFGGDVCEQLRKLLEMSSNLSEFFAWMFNADGSEVSQEFKAMIQDIATPVGGVLFYPFNAVPAGYLILNGQNVSRTTYANLFAVWGTTFGVGDGSTTFGLPNFQDKFLCGSGTNAVFGATGGEASHTLTASEMPTHSHPFPSGDDASGFLLKTSAAGKALDIVASGDAISVPATGDAGGSQPHENRPPFFAGYWLVKY